MSLRVWPGNLRGWRRSARQRSPAHAAQNARDALGAHLSRARTSARSGCKSTRSRRFTSDGEAHLHDRLHELGGVAGGPVAPDSRSARFLRTASTWLVTAPLELRPVQPQAVRLCLRVQAGEKGTVGPSKRPQQPC